ncbi:hypothetical protein QYM36_018010, partial [Artemia franciscana]
MHPQVLKVKRASDNWEVDSGQGSEPDPHSLQHSSAIRSNSQCQCNQGTMQTTAFNGQAVNGHEINGDQLANETRDQLLDSHQASPQLDEMFSQRGQRKMWLTCVKAYFDRFGRPWEKNWLDITQEWTPDHQRWSSIVDQLLWIPGKAHSHCPDP